MSRPRASDYRASEGEKAEAAVALAEKNYFRQNYLPKLTELRDKAQLEDQVSVAQGVAGADTMQALTGAGNTSLGITRGVNTAADRASAGASQMIEASKEGTQASYGDQLGVLKSSRGLMSQTQSGLARVARQETTDRLESAKRRQSLTDAQFNMIGQPVASFLGKRTFAFREAKKNKMTDQNYFDFLRNPTYKKDKKPEEGDN
tara:strand:- start:2583 stop:3194 length:612 start_codon:yes stop_codon:yes gene_type:complete